LLEGVILRNLNRQHLQSFNKGNTKQNPTKADI
jgi:hypothetical protein